MPTKSGQFVYLEDGTTAQQTYSANGLDPNGAIPQDIQARWAQTIDLISAQSVAAGADYTNTTTFDFSQYSLAQYGYSTSSTGTGTANIFLFDIEGSNTKNSLKSGINSNQTAFIPVFSPVDVRGYNTLRFGFRNADIQSVTVNLKAYVQI